MTSLHLVYEWLCNTKEESQIRLEDALQKVAFGKQDVDLVSFYTLIAPQARKFLGFLCIIKGKTDVISHFSAAGGPNWSIFPYKSSVINCKSVSFASRVVIRLVHLHISEK